MVGEQERMGVMKEVLEKMVGINWRTLTVLSIALASSSQSFCLNEISEL